MKETALRKLIAMHSAGASKRAVNDLIKKVHNRQLGIMTAANIEEIVSRIRKGNLDGISPNALAKHDEFAIIQPMVIVHVVHRWAKRSGKPAHVTVLVEDSREHVKFVRRGFHTKRIHTHERLHRRDGIGMKLKIGENPLDGARRCIEAKLEMKGLVPELDGRTDIVCTLHPKLGKIPIILVRHHVTCNVPTEKYDPIGRVVTRTKPSGVQVKSDFIWLPRDAVYINSDDTNGVEAGDIVLTM